MTILFGNIVMFKFVSFGESHGSCIGGVVEGCPSGIAFDYELVNADLLRRKSATTLYSSQRKEDDEVELLSGVYQGVTTGAPIAFMVRNNDAKSIDYEAIKNILRPSHADYTYWQKYGHYDPRGGGRYSARESVAKVVAGAIAKMVIAKYGITIEADISRIGVLEISKTTKEELDNYLEKIRTKGDSVGGIISCVIKNVPVGLGEPLDDKLQSHLAYRMMSINGAKGFEYGSGFQSAKMRGSQCNDSIYYEGGKFRTRTNNSGGIVGGISNGEDIYFNVAFKPTPTIMQTQITVDKQGNTVELKPKGRHDVCYVPRAVPIVEAMAAMVIADFKLR